MRSGRRRLAVLHLCEQLFANSEATANQGDVQGPSSVHRSVPSELHRRKPRELALAALSEGDNPLTRREQEVLTVALDGASITEIAARLVVSEGTVRNHISTAIQKLGAQNRMEAARLAEQKGWL